jgi:hypothetical protein
MESAPTPLGVFGRLPTELRFMIWEYFYPKGDDRGKTDLAILRTNSTIYHEIMDCFRWPESLGSFEVVLCPDPQCPIRIYDESHTICWDVSASLISEYPGERPGFAHLPIDELDVVVNIMAPGGSDDPGRVICIWEKCLALVRILNAVTTKSVKLLLISLDDHDFGTWVCGHPRQTDDVHPTQSLPVTMNFLPFLSWFHGFRSDDIAMAVNPFFTALRVDEVEIMIGNRSRLLAEHGGYDRELQSRIQTDQERILQSSSWKLAYHESRLSLMFLSIQTALDSAAGPTSASLRLKRYIQWSEDPRAYEDLLRVTIYRCSDEIRQGNLGAAIRIDLWTRYGLMRLADPGFYNGRFAALVDMDDPERQEALARLMVTDFLFGQASNADAWHEAFPHGILPFENAWWDRRKSWLGRLGELFTADLYLVQNTFLGELFRIQFE